MKASKWFRKWLDTWLCYCGEYRWDIEHRQPVHIALCKHCVEKRTTPRSKTGG